MRANGPWTSLLLLLIVVGATGAGLAIWVRYTDAQFVLGVLGVSVAVITASIQYAAAKEKEINARLFAEKREVYTDLIKTLMGLFHERKPNPTAAEQTALVKKIQGIRTQLLVWGSAATLLALDRMSSIQIESSGMPINGTRWLSELFAAIRKDLGHNDPQGAALEMALGMINEPDRSMLRQAINAQPRR